MDPRTLEWLHLLARGLIWGAVAVFVLALVGAIQIATSNNELGIAPEFEKQSRGIVALAALGGGLTAAGILAGLGAILHVLLEGRRRGPSD